LQGQLSVWDSIHKRRKRRPDFLRRVCPAGCRPIRSAGARTLAGMISTSRPTSSSTARLRRAWARPTVGENQPRCRADIALLAAWYWPLL